MTGQRRRTMAVSLLAAGLLAAATLTACARTTSGAGGVATGSAAARTSTPDFPSGSVAVTQGASTPAGSSVAPTTHPVPSAPLKTVTVRASDGTVYPVRLWADVQDATCFDHAYGSAVVSFLTTHPCGGLRRVLGTTAVNGRPVAFAQSSTGFRGPTSDPYKWVGAFIKLEEQDGTGSINDLLREGYRLPEGPTAVPSSEVFNVVGQDQGVTIWDAWYLDGKTSDTDPKLTKMTEDLFLQF